MHIKSLRNLIPGGNSRYAFMTSVMLPLNVQGANNFRIIFPDAELVALDVNAALPRRDSFAYRRPGPGSCERWGWGA